nr:uncharacterized protein LOC113809210 isoform X1 [Penaeus vannamei]
MNPDKPQDMKRKSWNTLESDRVNYPTESDLDNSSTESQQDNFKIQSDLYNFKIQSDLDNSPTESQQDNLPTDWRLNTLFPDLEDLNHDESWMSLVDENNHGNSSQTAPNQEEPTPVVFPEEAPRELVEKQPRDTDNEISDASSSQKSPNQGEPAPTVHHEEEAQLKLISPRYALTGYEHVWRAEGWLAVVSHGLRSFAEGEAEESREEGEAKGETKGEANRGEGRVSGDPTGTFDGPLRLTCDLRWFEVFCAVARRQAR